MMRAIRRAFRQWTNEWLGFWGRFTAFHRIVCGIVLAMVIVFGSRRQFLDARKLAVSELRSELIELGAPETVLPPDQDEEVQQAELQAESLQRSLKREQAETREQLVEMNMLGRSSARATIDVIAEQIAANNLHVRSSAPTECDGEFPLERICRSYEIAGAFDSVHDFLKNVAGMTGAGRATKLLLHRIDDDSDSGSASGSESQIGLTFVFESVYAED